MARKRADVSLLNMPGVPQAPRSPSAAAGSATAIKPTMPTAASGGGALARRPLPQVTNQPQQPSTAFRTPPTAATPAPTPATPRGGGTGADYTAYQNAIRNTKILGTAGGYGEFVDTDSPAVAKYWADQQAELRRQWDQSDVSPDQLLQRFNPEAIGRRYIVDNVAAQQAETASELRGTGPVGAYQRLLGFKRYNPATGQYEVTADANIGKDPNGRASAWRTSAAAIPLAAAAAVTAPVQGILGNWSPTQGAFRSLMAGPNHERGMDIGHQLGTTAELHTPWTAEPGLRDIFTNATAATTPNLVGSPVYDPLTRTYKPSQANAAAGQARLVAMDPANTAGPVSKSLANMTASALENARDVYGGATVGAGLGGIGGPAAMGNVARGSVALGALNLTDPMQGDTASQRVLPAAVDAFTGAMSPIAANPAVTGTAEVLNRSGVQDKFNVAGNYIRDTLGDEASPMWQRALANSFASGLETLPQAASGLLQRNPKSVLPGAASAKQYVMNALKGTGQNVGSFGAMGAAAGGLSAMATPTPQTPEELAQAEAQAAYRRLPIAEQDAARLADFMEQSEQFRQNNGPAATPPQADALPVAPAAEMSTPEAPATEAPGTEAATPQVEPTPQFDPLTVLPNGQQVRQYAESNPEMAVRMQEAATTTVTSAAATPEGKQELAQLEQTGDLSPKANEVVKYNLINDGFDADKIGEWYGNLGGAEKFALWGGVSMTVLGLMHAMNGGGVGSVLAALLGLGTAGLTAGQSGLFGNTAQEQSQKITQPIGSAVSGGLTSLAGSALANPSVLKAVAPYFDHLPDSALQKMQDYMRQSKDPEMMKKVEGLNTVAGQGLLGGLNSMLGNPAKQQALQQLTEAGFTPATANRYIELWAKPK